MMMKTGPGRRLVVAVGLWFASTISWPRPVGAATLKVTTTDDSGPGSLRQAIQAAAPDDSIDFSVSGTITLTNGELVIATNLNIFGPGAARLTVSGTGTSRVFSIRGGTISLSGLTITSGWLASGHGAGISNAGALSIAHCTLLNNRTLNGCGGGVYNSGSLAITDTTILANQVGGIGAFGGAIFTTSGRLTITTSVLLQNSAVGVDGGSAVWPQSPPSGVARGGGLYIDSGEVILANCSFARNVAVGGIGGVVATPQGLSGLPGGSGSGGGLFMRNGALTILNSTFSSNSVWGGRGGAGGPGGSPGFGGGGLGAGVFLDSGSLTATNTTLSGNAGTGGPDGFGGTAGGAGAGGGIFVSAATATTVSCTIVGNVAVGGTTLIGFPPGPGYGSGGGIYNERGNAVSLLNSIVAANRASTTGPDVVGGVTSQGYNLIGVTNESRGWLATDRTGNTNAPINPMVGPLQDNGGPTWTMALLPGSPAIEGGASPGLIFDQRGRLRPVDDPDITNAPGGDGSDIGAFEFQSQPITLAGPVQQGSDIVVSFMTEVGHTYRLERKDAPTPGSWTVVADDIAGTGGIVELIDPVAAGQPARFYRGRILP